MPLICVDCSKEKSEIYYYPYEEIPVPRCGICHFAAMAKNGWALTEDGRILQEKKKAEAFARLKALREAKKKDKEEAKRT